MGKYNALAVTLALGCAYLLHTYYNTSYEWAALWVASVVVALIYKDTPLLDVARITRNYFKSKVDYASWWTKRN